MTISNERAKALSLLQQMEAKTETSNLDSMLAKLFAIPNPNIPNPATTREELKELIKAIKDGTEDNLKLTRFIEIAKKVLET